MRDLVDWQVGQLEQATSFEEPLSSEPPLGGFRFRRGSAAQTYGRPAGVPGEVGHGQGLVESLQRPTAPT